jgi:hypothetical protein
LTISLLVSIFALKLENMELFIMGAVRVYLKGTCGGHGCDSCDCEIITYNEAKVYVSGNYYIIVTTSDCGDDTIVETFEFNKIKTLKIN